MHLNKLSSQQIESIFLSYVVPSSAIDVDDYPHIVRQVGGAENMTKLISSLNQLIRNVSFFNASEHQVKQLLSSEVDGLSSLVVELLCKLCHDNMSEWRKNHPNCGEELLQEVDWVLKMIPCTSAALFNEPRVQMQLKMDGKMLSLDADRQGMRSLYNKLEEVQSKLDQMAKSSLQKEQSSQ